MSNYESAKERLKLMFTKGCRGDELTEDIDIMLRKALRYLDETRNVPPSQRDSIDTTASSNSALLIAKEIATILNLPLNWPRIALESIALSGDSVRLWSRAIEILNEIDELCKKAGYISLERRHVAALRDRRQRKRFL